MKIKIDDTPQNIPTFPAFYTDDDGDLWLWGNYHSCVHINSGTFHVNDDCEEVDFGKFHEEHNFTKVVGTITITV